MANRYVIKGLLSVVVAGVVMSLALSFTRSMAAPPAELSFALSEPVVYRATATTQPFRIPSPASVVRQRAPTAAISVNFLAAGATSANGDSCLAWPSSAQTAFSFALSVWGGLLSSSVPIAVNACWASLPSGVLGHAGGYLVRNFTGAPITDTWYSIALANALSGTDLNGGTAEIEASFSNGGGGINWYFGTDGNPGFSQYDFVTVVLHEVGHGLGFSGSMKVNTSTGQGSWGDSGSPRIYDRFTQNLAGQSLINTTLFPNPSTALATQLTSGNIFFNGTNANAANSGARVKLYAPAVWVPGSSYSHLDDSYLGTVNTLMTRGLDNGTAVHNPGPVTLGIFRDLGWPQGALATFTPTSTATPTGTATPQSVTTPSILLSYFPLVSWVAAAAATPSVGPGGGGIYGHVTMSGAPAGGIALELDLDNGTAFSVVKTVTTDANGNYTFTGVPSLAAGQAYNVFYLNPEANPNRVGIWGTRDITAYTAGASVAAGNFDISNVSLVAPSHLAVVSLPSTFEWTARPATPSDSYALSFLDKNINLVGLTPPLGYVNKYTLTSLWSTMAAGLSYNWVIAVLSPDGGLGVSYYYRTITFTNTGRSMSREPTLADTAAPSWNKLLRRSNLLPDPLDNIR